MKRHVKISLASTCCSLSAAGVDYFARRADDAVDHAMLLGLESTLLLGAFLLLILLFADLVEKLTGGES